MFVVVWYMLLIAPSSLLPKHLQLLGAQPSSMAAGALRFFGPIPSPSLMYFCCKRKLACWHHNNQFFTD